MRRSRRTHSCDHLGRRSKKPKRSNEEPLSDEKEHAKETEEEYDGRLEREELERLRIERKKDWEHIRNRFENGLESHNAIRFKGKVLLPTR